MNLDVVAVGDPVLRRRADAVDEAYAATPFVQELIASMCQTMKETKGVGLAAPQVGESLQIFVMGDEDEQYLSTFSEARLAELGRRRFPMTAIINPTLERIGDPDVYFFEGCLSMPGFVALVPRHARVRVTGVDQNWDPVSIELDGWPARIAQHEVDHLGGSPLCRQDGLPVAQHRVQSVAPLEGEKRFGDPRSVDAGIESVRNAASSLHRNPESPTGLSASGGASTSTLAVCAKVRSSETACGGGEVFDEPSNSKEAPHACSNGPSAPPFEPEPGGPPDHYAGLGQIGLVRSHIEVRSVVVDTGEPNRVPVAPLTRTSYERVSLRISCSSIVTTR